MTFQIEIKCAPSHCRQHTTITVDGTVQLLTPRLCDSVTRTLCKPFSHHVSSAQKSCYLWQLCTEILSSVAVAPRSWDISTKVTLQSALVHQFLLTAGLHL
jgi:hypothetical protein